MPTPGPARNNPAPLPRLIVTLLPWALAAGFALMTGALLYNRYERHLELADFAIRDKNQQAELDQVQTRDVEIQRALDEAGKNNAELRLQVDYMKGKLADVEARDTLSEIKIAMLASMAKDAPQARAVIAWDGAAQRGILKTRGMPAPGPDQDYQLWVTDPGYKAPVSAGVFDPSAGSNFEPVQRITNADKFSVSLERKGGSDELQGPIVLMSE